MAYLDGSVLLQTRSLPRIMEIATLPYRGAPSLPSKEELEEFLSFLSILAMANGLRYDPTVPHRFHSSFLEAADSLGVSNCLSPIMDPGVNDDYNQFVSDMQAAFAMASDDVETVLSTRLSRGHKPISEAVLQGFVTSLEDMEAAKDEDSRTEVALSAYLDGQMGGKLLLGLAAKEHTSHLKRILYAIRTKDRMAVMSSMINLFRTFLLSSWAARHGASFAGPPKYVERITAHQFAFWGVLERELKSRCRLQIPEYHDTAVHLPMVGAAILLSAPSEARPQDLIHAALKAGKELGIPALARVFWDVQDQASERDSADLVREAAGELWERVLRRGGPKLEKFTSPLEDAKSAVTLSARLAVAVAIAEAVAGGGPWEVLAGAGKMFISALIIELATRARHDDKPAAVLSNLVAIHKDKYHLVEQRAKQVWRALPT